MFFEEVVIHDIKHTHTRTITFYNLIYTGGSVTLSLFYNRILLVFNEREDKKFKKKKNKKMKIRRNWLLFRSL